MPFDNTVCVDIVFVAAFAASTLPYCGMEAFSDFQIEAFSCLLTH